MSFERILRRTWSENRLFSVLLELTYRCNLDCYFCYNDLGLRGRPLALQQYFALFAGLRELEVLHLTLSGGEPLAHPDFLRLGARARELGFVVRIKSNGHALHGAMARRIRDEIDPFLIEVSLHGASAPVHDRQTRVAGSFDRLLANLEELRRLGLRVKLNSTLTAWNEHETEAMFELADRLDLPLQVDPEVTQRDDGDRSPLSITASRDGVRRLFALLAERSRAAATETRHASPRRASPPHPPARQADDGLAPAGAEKHCGAGSSGIAIDPLGNVYPCVQWRRPVGNLHEQSIGEIWATSPALRQVRALTAAAKGVVDGAGPAGALLAFCPGNAEALSGDPLRIYAGATRRMEILQDLEIGAAREIGEIGEEGAAGHAAAAAPRRTLLPVLPS